MRSNTTILILMVCSLLLQNMTGQADDCVVNDDSSSGSVHAVMMDHEGHDMSHDMTTHTTASQMNDCCPDGCECLMMTCQLLLIDSQVSSTTLIIPFQPVSKISERTALGSLTVIDRPPIFA